MGASAQANEKKRPLGVTVLAILNIIIGLADLIGGLLLGGSVFLGWFDLGAFAWLIGDIIALQGIVLFLLAYGFMFGKVWAWTLGLIFGIWDIALGIIALPGGIIRIIYGAVIIYYIMRPNVKTFFGKS